VKKKERVERVTRALIGFRPGQSVRIVRPGDSWLSACEGEIVILELRLPDEKNHPKNRWRLKGKAWWLAECSMELL
jgi:hypothetical protein